MSEIYDDTLCQLGEGPLWHPERQALFWFDIVNGRLYCRENDQTRHWQFDDMVSAAGWVDRDTLIIASERAPISVKVAAMDPAISSGTFVLPRLAATMEFSINTGSDPERMPPPALPAEFSAIVLKLMLSGPPASMPPPNPLTAVFFVMVLERIWDGPYE